MRVSEDQELADTERYAKLARAFARLEVLPNTTIPDVVAAQRARVVEELLRFALRRASRTARELELVDAQRNRPDGIEADMPRRGGPACCRRRGAHHRAFKSAPLICSASAGGSRGVGRARSHDATDAPQQGRDRAAVGSWQSPERRLCPEMKWLSCGTLEPSLYVTEMLGEHCSETRSGTPLHHGFNRPHDHLAGWSCAPGTSCPGAFFPRRDVT